MLKVLHIHTDPKFLTYNPAFDEPSFSNSVIFISGNKQDIRSLYPMYDIIEIDRSRKGLEQAIKIANNVDLIVVYMMDICNSFICNRVKPDIPIIWRFFGAELYGKLDAYVFSELTKQVVGNKKYPLVDRVKNVVGNIISYGVNYRTEFNRAIVRANAIAMLYRQEYDFLSRYFTLPKFIQLSYGNNEFVNPISNKTNKIIIGNSRNKYNNHLDIIQLIKRGAHSNYFFELPFNYGEESLYSNIVMQEIGEFQNVHVIKNFMPKNEYINLFSTAAAFVFNAHRQMAMGNIFIAIKNNTKIYLNPKNSAYHWLLDEGFCVFPIDNLVEDMNNENIYLSAEEYGKNSMALNSLSQKYNVGSLVKEIYNLINDKSND